jgi:hypothetical protein
MPSSCSYRSARMNQNANPPVLWVAVLGAAAARTPRDPFLPDFCHPRRSIIRRTSIPIACRSRFVRAAWTPERNRSIAGCDSSSRTTPANGGRSWCLSDSSIRRCRSSLLKKSSTSLKGCSGSFTTSENALPSRCSRNSSRVTVAVDILSLQGHADSNDRRLRTWLHGLSDMRAHSNFARAYIAPTNIVSARVVKERPNPERKQRPRKKNRARLKKWAGARVWLSPHSSSRSTTLRHAAPAPADIAQNTPQGGESEGRER